MINDRKVVSCSVYRGCQELLELRIRHLIDNFDEFIIAESDYNMAGEPREFSLIRDILKIGLPTQKIKIVQVKSENIPPKELSFESRFDAIFDSMASHIPKNSVVFVTDEDEIPSKEFVQWYASMMYNHGQTQIVKLPLTHLSASLNFRLKDTLSGKFVQSVDGYVCLDEHLKIHSISELRRKITRDGKFTYINLPVSSIYSNQTVPEVGWKFQWMGNNQTKLELYKASDRYATDSHLGRDLRIDFIKTYAPLSGGQDPVALRDCELAESDISNYPAEIFLHDNLKSFFRPEYNDQARLTYRPLAFDYDKFSKISVGSNMKKKIWIVEDFYDDPDSVREFALHQDFFDDEGFIGKRTRKQFFFPGLKERFEEIMGKKITNWESYGMNGRFQHNISGEKLTWHCDSQQWAGLIYLTPDAPFNAGTRMAAFRANRVRHQSHPRLMDCFNQKTFLDGTLYEDVDIVGNVYNRLVIYDAGLIHAAMQYFGYDKDTSRLWHMFFFDAE